MHTIIHLSLREDCCGFDNKMMRGQDFVDYIGGYNLSRRNFVFSLYWVCPDVRINMHKYGAGQLVNTTCTVPSLLSSNQTMLIINMCQADGDYFINIHFWLCTYPECRHAAVHFWTAQRTENIPKAPNSCQLSALRILFDKTHGNRCINKTQGRVVLGVF